MSESGALHRLAFIDALRGYAVLGVLIVHTGQYCDLVHETAFGARGVQLFFVVSALTLVMSWHQRNDGATAFFIRRLFRIAPMFWLAIPVYYLALGPVNNLPAIAGAAAFLQALRPDWIVSSVVPGGWSVSVEMMFYLVMPLIGAFVTTLTRAVVLGLVTLILARQWSKFGVDISTAMFPGFSPGEISTFVILAFPSQMIAFACGVICYFTVKATPDQMPRILSELALIVSVAVGIYYAAYDTHNLAAFSVVFAIIAFCLAKGAGQYLVNPLICHFGKISFSVYLLHWLALGQALHFLKGTSEPKHWLAFLALTAVFSAALCSLTYYAIERPFLRLSSALTRRAKPRLVDLR